jgi:transposase
VQIIYTHCAGLDVHKKTVVACCVTPGPDGQPQFETRTFGTMTQDLLALADWLSQQGVTHVALESTGEFVRRITARAIPPAGRLGAEGHPGVNN